MQYRTRKSGFTLVEILIVVIILGILAAIVIPQFTNASEDARKNSLTSQLQTIRSQIELYKLQHRDAYPTSDGTLGADATWDWSKLTGQTDENGDAYDSDSTTGPFGPYLQSDPKNNLNGNSGVMLVADDDAAATADPDDGTGFIVSRATGKIWATNKANDGLHAE
jgi:general secretion pathway protein G